MTLTTLYLVDFIFHNTLILVYLIMFMFILVADNNPLLRPQECFTADNRDFICCCIFISGKYGYRRILIIFSHIILFDINSHSQIIISS